MCIYVYVYNLIYIHILDSLLYICIDITSQTKKQKMFCDKTFPISLFKSLNVCCKYSYKLNTLQVLLLSLITVYKKRNKSFKR